MNGVKGHTTTISRYRQLHGSGDRILNHLAQTTASVCGVKTCIIALLDPREVGFKQMAGVEEGAIKQYAPFAAYGLLHSEVFTIPDVHLVPELEVGLKKADPTVRFLAGIRVADDDGVAHGSVCLCDPEPRSLTAEQQLLLSGVAKQVMAHSGLRNELRALQSVHIKHLRRLEVLQGLVRAVSKYAIIGTDPSGAIRMFNQGAEHMLGFRVKEVTGQKVHELFHDPRELRAHAERLSAEHRRRLISSEALWAQAREGQCEEQEWTLISKSGRRFPAAMAVAPAHSEDGELTGFVLIARDISARKAAERDREQFISMMNHELRTPLTSIRGAVGLLNGGAGGALSNEATELLGITQSNVERMSRIVDDILELYRIDRTTIDLAKRPCNLADLVRQAVQQHEPYAVQFDVRLVLAEGPAELWCEVDAERIMQVLANLLSNAAKFSPAGQSVEVSVARVDGRVRVAVSDHGPGIPEEFQPHVFERFMQAKTGDGKHRLGSGLGLSIAQAIISGHNGRLAFETEVGSGTTFFFELAECLPAE